jgi:guanylate kinase
VTGLGRAFPLVIAAPSGAGKTSLARALIDRHPDVVFSISATTRPAREYERQGVDYMFVDDERFDAMIRDEELLEWAIVHGRRYGTPRQAVSQLVQEGRTVVLDIDVQGARQIRGSYPDAVLVFILPPSAAELNRRLLGRGSEGAAQRATRLRTALKEIGAAAEFDYVVVNDEFERALASIEAIIRAERHRTARSNRLPEAIASMEAELDDIIRGVDA